MQQIEEKKRSFSKQTSGIAHGAITLGDWGALCRTLLDVHGSFGEKPRPGLIVEVGTLGGKTTQGIMGALSALKWETPDVLTIDTDKPCLGRAHSLCSGYKNLLRSFHGCSTDWKPVEPIWWAFIDGCHCHDCVLADLKHLSVHVPVGGVICLHDAGKQREMGMLVHERYHGHDGKKRLYGVTSAIDAWLGDLDDWRWEQVENIPAQERPRGAPTPLFGGLQAFRRT